LCTGILSDFVFLPQDQYESWFEISFFDFGEKSFYGHKKSAANLNQ